MLGEEQGGSGQRVFGRYVVYSAIASGGMATVHFGRQFAPGGFSKTVAVKRIHPHLASTHDILTMFLDEARLAARIRHPNVVSTLDIVSGKGELFIVMEYVEGETLSRLLHAPDVMDKGVPPRIALGIVNHMLAGLHAAHEAVAPTGEPLAIVHRDVSPQNVIVGVDGVTRVLDFGVAKADVRRLESTSDGAIKGKVGYMSPEQLTGAVVDRRSDVFAAAVVAWETLTGRTLFPGQLAVQVITQVLHAPIPAPSTYAPGIAKEIDAVVLRGLERDPAKRYASAEKMAEDLEWAGGVASSREIGQWVRASAAKALAKRAALVADIERSAGLPSMTMKAAGSTEVPTAVLVVGGGSGPTLEMPHAISTTGVFADTQVQSNLPVATARTVAKRRRLIRRIAIAAVVLVTGLGIFALGLASRGPRPESSGTPAPSRVETAAPVASSAAAILPPVANSATVADDAPDAAAVPLHATRTSGSPVVVSPSARPRTPPSASPSAPPAPNCVPPYVTGSDGIRHFKKECL